MTPERIFSDHFLGNTAFFKRRIENRSRNFIGTLYVRAKVMRQKSCSKKLANKISSPISVFGLKKAVFPSKWSKQILSGVILFTRPMIYISQQKT